MTALISISINNFRGFEKAVTFSFDKKPLVLLTAPNGKGKTTLIDAIEWCLTGDVCRLHQSYDMRNPSGEVDLKLNKQTILKNKNHLNETTAVTLQLEKDNQIYTITRSQDFDTLDDCGNIQVNEKSGKDAQHVLDSLVDNKNFYKYHVCDLQKTYNFLRTGRSGMSQIFSDFTADHSTAENVAVNLNIFSDDIDQRIKSIGIVPEQELNIYRNILERYEKSPEILPYNIRLLYPSEQTNIKQMNYNQLNEHLRKLYSCGYARVISLLEEQQKGEIAKDRKEDLDTLYKEFVIHSEDILEAVKVNANKPITMKESIKILQKYSEISLTSDNLAGNSEELLKIGSIHFTNKYWKESTSKLNDIKKQQEELDAEIGTLKKGNEVIDALTAITAAKAGLLQYRNEKQKEAPNQLVLCPVCGSNQFGTIDEDDITQKAQSYQAEHKELIEKKKQNLNNLIKRSRAITSEQLVNAKTALKEAIYTAQEHVNKLTRLYNVSKAYFSLLKKLQATDREAYIQEKMLSKIGIRDAIEKNNKDILSVERTDDMKLEVQRILAMVNYSMEEHFAESALLEDMRANSTNVPEGVMYDENLLRNKISSIRSRIQNLEFLDATRNLNEANKKNDIAKREIEGLVKLSNDVKRRAEQIRALLKDIKIKEYDNVGPYLYKIFRKLSRDINVSGIELMSGKGDDLLLLTDDHGKPILNMLSDGQLSVFMFSYFVGNIYRIKPYEQFQVYFIDDITSCMDDINMLAFLDFIKYQLSWEDSAINQLFFSTCDNRVQDMLSYKMDHCAVDYKSINTSEFDDQLLKN